MIEDFTWGVYLGKEEVVFLFTAYIILGLATELNVETLLLLSVVVLLAWVLETFVFWVADLLVFVLLVLFLIVGFDSDFVFTLFCAESDATWGWSALVFLLWAFVVSTSSSSSSKL